MIVFAVIWTKFHGVSDFSIVKGYLLVLFLIIVFLFVYPLIINYIGSKNQSYLIKLLNVFVIVFVLQSIIQIIGFLNPSFASIIRLFHKIDFINDDRNKFINFRGLALTGNPFFSLASGYCLVFVCYFYLLSINKISRPVIKFFLILTGSFFSGRTAFMGLIVGVFFICLMNQIIKQK
ncbi:hypothetical protein [Aquimarina agarivorans]|uniref:hypothetical protein n=1 Tax=Aquimarina agarivorans TaxID=980584 RepID=UPI000248EB2F|nr:hypothetical protein [Aquimarina agarivorans]